MTAVSFRRVEVKESPLTLGRPRNAVSPIWGGLMRSTSASLVELYLRWTVSQTGPDNVTADSRGKERPSGSQISGSKAWLSLCTGPFRAVVSCQLLPYVTENNSFLNFLEKEIKTWLNTSWNSRNKTAVQMLNSPLNLTLFAYVICVFVIPENSWGCIYGLCCVFSGFFFCLFVFDWI